MLNEYEEAHSLDKEKLNSVDSNGNNYLHQVCKVGDLKIVGVLIRTGSINGNSTNILNQTPAHIATMHKKFDVLRYLCLNGAEINARDKNKYTVLSFACQFDNNAEEHINIINFLISKGANPKFHDYLGRSPCDHFESSIKALNSQSAQEKLLFVAFINGITSAAQIISILTLITLPNLFHEFKGGFTLLCLTIDLGLQYALLDKFDYETFSPTLVIINYGLASAKLASSAIGMAYYVSTDRALCGSYLFTAIAAVASIYQTWAVKTNEYDYLKEKVNWNCNL